MEEGKKICTVSPSAEGKAVHTIFPNPISLPANSFNWVSARIKGKLPDGLALFTPREFSVEDNDLFWGEGIVEVKDNIAYLPVTSNSPTPVELNSCTPVGNIARLECESIAAVNHTQRSNQNEKERLNSLYQIIDSKFQQGSRENHALRKIVTTYPHAFSLEEDPLTITDRFYHEIRTDKIVHTRPYPIPLKYQDQVHDQIEDLLKRGIIRPSASPWNHPLVPVVKKDGSIRICLDFRKMNESLPDDTYPIPSVQEILNQLGNNALYSTLDMRSSFHQIPLKESSCEKTAFTTPRGRWEYLSLPFGLKDSGNSFQRCINSVMSGMIGKGSWVYLDDVIVGGSDFDTHLNNIMEVAKRLQDNNLSLKFDKCEFFKEELDFLGHKISKQGIQKQPQKVEAIKRFPRPKTVKQVLSFTGLANYYRKFVPNFSKIAHPLYELTKGRESPKINANVKWNQEAEEAFQKLKTCLAEDIILIHPDFKKDYYLTTDASDKAVGGVLEQMDSNGQRRPISYFSRTLNAAEQNYNATEREALGVIWGLKFNRSLCLGFKIHVLTDHKPLVAIFNTAKNHNSRVARWKMCLAEFDIQLSHVDGKSNHAADALSRIELDSEIIGLINTNEQIMEEAPWNLRELALSQNRHSKWGKLKEYLKGDTDVIPKKLPLPITEFKILEDGLLYRQTVDSRGQKLMQLVIPEDFIDKAISRNHVLPIAGHGGRDATIARLKTTVYWPDMKNDVTRFIRKCPTCLRFKPARDAHAPLQKYPDVSRPFQRIHLDLIGPIQPTTENGNKYILSIIDVFTRYGFAVPLKTKTAAEVTDAYVKEIIKHHGAPEQVISDCGKEFLNQVFQGVQKLFGTSHKHTSPYHPSCNGMAERYNASLIKILKTITKDNPQHWDLLLNIAVLAYNSAYHRVIRESPFFLYHLRDANLPYAELSKITPSFYNTDDYVRRTLLMAMKTFKITEDILKNEAELMVRNSKGKLKEIEIGARVYLLNHKKKGKLAPSYLGPFRVIAKTSDVNYVLRNIATYKLGIWHSDKIRIIPEDNIDNTANSKVRRPYPVSMSENDELDEMPDECENESVQEYEKEDRHESDLDKSIPQTTKITSSKVTDKHSQNLALDETNQHVQILPSEQPNTSSSSQVHTEPTVQYENISQHQAESNVTLADKPDNQSVSQTHDSSGSNARQNNIESNYNLRSKGKVQDFPHVMSKGF